MSSLLTAAPPVVKPADGFFTTFFVSPASVHVARVCARAGFKPDQVTAFSMALGVGAAAAFATGEREGYVAGAVIAYFAFFFDCVDGQLARHTRTFSARGAYLDGMLDRGKEYVIYAGLAIGGDAWALACAAIALQTTRHAIDLGARAGGRAAAEPATWLTWIKRMSTFPIGERFAVMVLVTAFAAPEATFIVLLAWGPVAFAYVVAGRLANGDRTWVLPAAQRAIEFGGIAAAGILLGVPAGAYCVMLGLAALRYHRLLA
ncbi:MAG: CDP-alcohol phosphatidyltransferase family protein [Solirubrobacteraceae bacterium]